MEDELILKNPCVLKRAGVENAPERPIATIEQVYGHDLTNGEFAFEVSYEGIVPLEEEALKDGSILDERFGGMGGWVASTLVKLGDLKLSYLPPEDED